MPGKVGSALRSNKPRLPHDAIVQSAENLPLMPYLFRPGRVPGTRELVVHPNYIVVYQVGSDMIDILRILHSGQQYP